MTFPVDMPESLFNSGPTVAFESPIRKSHERAGGDFFHGSKRVVFTEDAARHFLPVCEQCLAKLRKCSRLDRPRVLLSELFRSLDENVCIANQGERPASVAKAKVLFVVEIVAQILTHQTESGPYPFEALADFGDSVVI
jgi:hypothetical protein